MKDEVSFLTTLFVQNCQKFLYVWQRASTRYLQRFIGVVRILALSSTMDGDKEEDFERGEQRSPNDNPR